MYLIPLFSSLLLLILYVIFQVFLRFWFQLNLLFRQIPMDLSPGIPRKCHCVAFWQLFWHKKPEKPQGKSSIVVEQFLVKIMCSYGWSITWRIRGGGKASLLWCLRVLEPSFRSDIVCCSLCLWLLYDIIVV